MADAGIDHSVSNDGDNPDVPVARVVARPDSVRVLGIPYTIDWNEELSIDDSAMYGRTDNAKLLIEINDSFPSEIQKTTLVHEILHAAWSHSSLRPLRTKDLSKTADMEELVVSGLETPMRTVFADNPDLIAWLSAA